MRFLHLVTVGTSVFRNALAVASRGEGVLSGFRGVLERVVSGGGLDSSVRGSGLFDALVSFVYMDPRRYSAELNAFLSVIDYLGVSSSVHDIVLFASDTSESVWAARVVESVVRDYRLERGNVVGDTLVERVDRLGVDFWPGLTNLLSRLVWHILQGKKRGYDRILVNLTGGFKPESAYSLLAVNIAGADAAYYIHEVSKKPVILPLFRVAPTPDTCRLLGTVLAGKEIRNRVILERMEEYGLAVGGRPTYHSIKLAELLQRFCE